MFLIFFSGSKSVIKPIGWVADFCPNCREVRAFELLRVGVAQHFYFVSASEGQLARHHLRCGTCNVRLLADPSHYAGTERRQPKELQKLVAATCPMVYERYAEPLSQAKKFRDQPKEIPQETRGELLFTSFRLFNPMVEHRHANWSDFDKYSGSGCLLTIAIMIVFFNRSCHYTGDTALGLIEAGFISMLIGLIVTLVLAMFGPSRYVKSCIIPGLVSGILQFDPSPDEVSQVVKRTRSLGFRIGKMVKPAQLTAALEAARSCPK
jgi:hypothetical protein